MTTRVIRRVFQTRTPLGRKLGRRIPRRNGHRTSALQHGRAADPHLGCARPGHSRFAVRGQARGFRSRGLPGLLAFADLEIPLGGGEKMWTPKMEARVLQELELEPGDAVLEIGTGSGYLAALLASAPEALVTSVEINARLANEERGRSLRGPASLASTSRLATAPVATAANCTTPSCLRARHRSPPDGLVASIEAGRTPVRRCRRCARDDGAPSRAGWPPTR